MVFDWLTRSRRTAPPARVPDGRLVYAIGDIHGRDDLLGRLLGAIEQDALAHADLMPVLVLVGDYVDRGTSSREVLERLIDGLPPRFERVALMGNHEAAMLEFLDGGEDGPAWLRYGGLETLQSYGVPMPRLPTARQDHDALRERALERIPARHLAFLRGCALWHVEGDYLFVHAGIRPGVALERQAADDLLWIRGEFLGSSSDFGGRVVVHGHTVCHRPQVRTNRINVDTGAYASGRLTAVALFGDQRRFIAT